MEIVGLGEKTAVSKIRQIFPFKTLDFQDIFLKVFEITAAVQNMALTFFQFLIRIFWAQ